MSGYQFVHIQTYARKAAKGRSISGILAEAGRQPEACPHVAQPAPPVVVHGGGLDVVRVHHDQALEAARSPVKGGRSRAVRNDQHTLLTVIASHPATSDQVVADPVIAAEVEAWQARAIQWMRDTWGDQLVSVVRHVDEGHPHLHAYIVPDAADAKAKNLHPGYVAKDQAKAAALDGGADAKAANTRGDAAYKAAMRTLQDGFFEAVGLPSGQARLGPGRRRLTRGAWQAEQAVAGATAMALKVAREAEAATSEAKSRAADLGDRGRAFVAKARQAASAAKASADAAQASLRDAEKAESRIRQRVGSVSALLAEVQGIRSELAQERAARLAAECDRERFRGLWAQADNALMTAKAGREL